jgi:hypothetical protein
VVIAAHHLAAAVRVGVSAEALDGVASLPASRQSSASAVDGLRQTWVSLATHEYVAVAALDGELAKPVYGERIGTLSPAVVEGAANVVCGARLAVRPAEFRHRRAWRHQAVALSYGLETYVAGLRGHAASGHAASLAQAQLIALTRLVRAAVAIAMLDLARAQAGAIS